VNERFDETNMPVARSACCTDWHNLILDFSSSSSSSSSGGLRQATATELAPNSLALRASSVRPSIPSSICSFRSQPPVCLDADRPHDNSPIWYRDVAARNQIIVVVASLLGGLLRL